MRTLNPSVHHVIANHPDVIRNLGWNPDEQGLLLFCNEIAIPERYVFLHSGEREYAIEELQANPSKCPGLGIVAEWTGPGVYQFHTMALPTFRGAKVIRAAKKLVYELFVDVGADLIWGATPIENKAARAFNRLIGAESCGFREIQKGSRNGEPIYGEHELFRNSRARWLAKHYNEKK